MSSKQLIPFAWLSVAAATVTLTLKIWAWQLTGSVSMMSDALESITNLAGAFMALWMLSLAALPADKNHTFGHTKAEYFSSGFEGFLIIAAACGISWAAIARLFNPQPMHELGLGSIITILASLVNLVIGWILINAGKKHRSITLEADGKHLLVDVWTSAAILLGLAAAWITNLWWIDSVLALLVAVNIMRAGFLLIRRSAAGLMDEALPEQEQQIIATVLQEWQEKGIAFHAIRTRQAGERSFATMHVLVPGTWSVQRGHDLLELIEKKLRSALPHLHVETHLEPIEDPRSMEDEFLDRCANSPPASATYNDNK